MWSRGPKLFIRGFNSSGVAGQFYKPLCYQLIKWEMLCYVMYFVLSTGQGVISFRRVQAGFRRPDDPFTVLLTLTRSARHSVPSRWEGAIQSVNDQPLVFLFSFHLNVCFLSFWYSFIDAFITNTVSCAFTVKVLFFKVNIKLTHLIELLSTWITSYVLVFINASMYLTFVLFQVLHSLTRIITLVAV